MRRGFAAIIGPLVLALGACSPAANALPTRPPVPAGWTIVEADSGGLRLALPPDIVAFDTIGAIFANQPPPAPGAEWIQLMAEGPGSESQPDPGESLDHWLERRWLSQEPDRGQTTTRELGLPAGTAVELKTSLAAATGHERLVTLYAIRSASGVAFLVIDGPPDTMRSRAADLDLIPFLLEFGPAVATSAPTSK